MLKGKHILLGITGSIAAYKAAIIVRLLVKQGAEVKIIMTPLAKEFITPLTLATLSKNPILVEFFNPENGDWNSHVDLGLWADLYLIAPATANTMAKMATGVADNLLLTSYLSARCPVVVAPAMDLDMFQHPTTQKNISTLKSYGNSIIEPTVGELASGLEGKGRMEEPEAIVNALSKFFASQQKLTGKTIMVTAGPTYEPIDPVRFIGNHSSGKMGYAVAQALANMGAKVHLISGPVKIAEPEHANITLHKVNTANSMFTKSVELFESCNAAIMAAAVADYTPENTANTKIKRTANNFEIKLKPTTDIAAHLGKIKKNGQVVVGFALETNNEIANAHKKLNDKNLDFIVLNSLNDEGAGFNHDTNKIIIIEKNNKTTAFELKIKADVANDIALKLLEYLP